MYQLWEAFVNLFKALGNLVVENQGWLVPGILMFVWVAWWFWGVNWPKLWGRLREGAWAPFVLLMVLVALVWSQIAPSDYLLGSTLLVPNFWWQLCGVGLLVCVALFCGWLQGYFGWTPAEVNLEPPAHGHDHGHGHEAGYELTHGHAHDSGRGHH